MVDRIRVYMGWDARDLTAFEVAKYSLLKHASIKVEVVPLLEWELRAAGYYWRSFHTDGNGQRWDDRDGKPYSTSFSFTRFCVPPLALADDDCPDWVLFCDPDILFRADIAELLDYRDRDMALYCVQHNHEPPEREKGLGIQTRYYRKNWSSFMWLNVLHPSHTTLTRYRINNEAGSWLHALCWLNDDEIGELPAAWNWLEGWSELDIEPKAVHFTRGTPDFIGYQNAHYALEWRDILGERAANLPALTTLKMEI